MKIIFVFPTSKIGGAERIMFNLAKYLAESNYLVEIFVLSSVKNDFLNNFCHSNISIIYSSFYSDKNIFSFITLYKRIYKNNYDYIFTSHILSNALVSIFLKIVKVNSKLISRESTVPFDRFKGVKFFIIKLFYKYFYGKQDLLIFQTDYMKESLLKNLKFSPVNNYKVIDNCVDMENIISQIKKGNLIKDEEITTIVACGRLVKLKQFDVLIKAFYKIVKLNKYKIQLIIIGSGPEGFELKKMVTDLSLNGLVIFTDSIDTPAAYFSIADIGIVSSYVEGFPNVLLEMMASGTRNVISTPCTPAVTKLPNIFLTDGFEVNDLFQTLLKVIEEQGDNSNENFKYIANMRSIKNYWLKVEQSMK